MKLIERTKDVITGNSNMEDLHKIKDFPIFMGCVEHSDRDDIKAEQIWQINKDTGVLQLKKVIPLEFLYQSQHDAGAVGSIWMEHHTTFSQFIRKFSPKSVFEIGGAHGILSIKYEQIEEIKWIIVEPNPNPVIGCKAKFIKGFFDKNFEYKEEIDTIVHSHVFEHIYKPDEFMHQLERFIPEGKKLIFSVPNMHEMLIRKYTNCLNFEHTVFLTEDYIEYLLSKYGFRILEKMYFREDHSIFYATVREAQIGAINLPKNLYKKNKKIFKDFIQYHEEVINNLNQKITQINGPIYLFGAHIFSQFLLKMGLEGENIISLLDNDKNKQGKRLYGTKFMVNPPVILLGIENPYVILKAGVYNNEIKEQIQREINKNTIFLE